MKLGVSLRAGLLAGVLAGIVWSLFSLAFTTPLIDRAIQMEQGKPGAVQEAFSRNMMKFGMVMGFLLYGLIIGLLFGAVYAMVKEKLPAIKERNKGFLLVFLAYWSIAFLPFLKYPANPPGVGGEDDIVFRQATYAAFMAISVLLAAASIFWFKYLSKAKKWRWPLTVAGYGIFAAAAYFLMPAHSFPSVTLPPDLLGGFRAVSLAGMTLFWLALAINFVFLGEKLSSGKLKVQNAK